MHRVLQSSQVRCQSGLNVYCCSSQKHAREQQPTLKSSQHDEKNHAVRLEGLRECQSTCMSSLLCS